jgi:hypothetical protein
MIAQRTPPIGLRALHDPRTYGIEIHLGQQVDQRPAVLDDQELESPQK